MGLDMYLYRREYVSGWSWKEGDTKEKDLYDTIMQHFDLARVEASPHVNIDVCVAYWRKANAIHGWFVDTCAGGVDECQPIHVSRERLVELRDLCKDVLLAPATSVEAVAQVNGLMPTPGFFFGSYDIDEWYMEDMKNTVEQLDKILESVSKDSWTSFIYQASW